MSTWNIRTAGVEDIPLIRTLCQLVWPATYATILSPVQLDYMMEWMYSPSSLKEQMDKGAVFLILYNQEQPVGYASFECLRDNHYKLNKLYIIPSSQGTGGGQFILNYIMQTIKAQGGHSIELQVNRYNKAVSFYQRMGFSILKEDDFHIGNGYYMNDFIMQIAL